MSAVRQPRPCTHNKTASFTSTGSWRWQLATALLAGMVFLGETCEEGQFMNSTSGSCQLCTRCGDLRLLPVRLCNATVNAECSPCPNPHEYYAVALLRCTLDCRLCPHNLGCPSGKDGQCDCSFDPTGCMIGVMCDQMRSSCIANVVTTNPTTQAMTSGTTHEPSQQAVLPHWGIALVSIGVIIGIVLFSALFVLLGLATSRRRGQQDDYSSSSNSGSKASTKSSSLADRLSYSNGGTSSSLMSLYTQTNSPAFQNYQLSLNALKNSSNSNFGSWNNIKSSPKTHRSSSVPITKPRDGFLTPV